MIAAFYMFLAAYCLTFMFDFQKVHLRSFCLIISLPIILILKNNAISSQTSQIAYYLLLPFFFLTGVLHWGLVLINIQQTQVLETLSTS